MKKIILVMFIILLVFFTFQSKVWAETASNISQLESEVKKILETVSPSILKVVAENHRKNFATGIAIDPDYVVSTIKLIQQPFDEIYIETAKGKKFTAQLVGKDYKSSLILLKINEKALTPIKPARVYEVGDWVALVGAFYKEFPSVYQGILSSALEDQVVLNAPVVPGASGGAVLNKKGELIGVIRGRIGFSFSPNYTFKDHSGEIHIESAKSQSKDLCVAVPAKLVMEITDELKQFGKVKRGWLGINIIGEDEEPVKISVVIKNSPAEKAGLRVGDTIVSIDGKSPKEPRDVANIVRELKPGKKVKIEIQRGGTRESVPVAVGESQDDRISWVYRYSPSTDMDGFIPEMPEDLPRPGNFIYTIGGNRTLGVELINMTPELAREFKIKDGIGLMISKVYKNTAAAKAGLQAADILVKAGNRPTKTYADLRNTINELADNEALEIRFYRQGKLEKVKVIPDINKEFGFMFDRFKDKMQSVDTRIDEEERKKIAEEVRKENQKLRQVRENYLKEIEMLREQYEKKYREEIKKMWQEQEKMKKELEKMKKELEKKAKESQQTTTTI